MPWDIVRGAEPGTLGAALNEEARRAFGALVVAGPELSAGVLQQVRQTWDRILRDGLTERLRAEGFPELAARVEWAPRFETTRVRG